MKEILMENEVNTVLDECFSKIFQRYEELLIFKQLIKTIDEKLNQLYPDMTSCLSTFFKPIWSDKYCNIRIFLEPTFSKLFKSKLK